jgi:hypothetical protein
MGYGVPNFLRSTFLLLFAGSSLSTMMPNKSTGSPVASVVLISGLFLFLFLASLQLFRRCAKTPAALNPWTRMLLFFAMLESTVGVLFPIVAIWKT